MARLRLYVRYTTRSLRRGGQRSVLAIFCIAVGVMAVVALRLAGGMIADSLTSNVREVLGGDISVQATAVPLTQDDLSALDAVRARGLIERYVPLQIERGTIRRDHIVAVPVYVLDDPAHFPLVGSADVEDPAGADYASLLRSPGSILLSNFAAEQAALHAGSTAHLNLVRGGGEDVTITGVLRSRFTAGNPAFAYISRATYDALQVGQEVRYGIVDIVAPDPDKAAQAAAELRLAYPSATVQTVKDALDQNITASDQLSQFLQIVGLLALLLGGIGVVNTMQVSLQRRRVEIAMLKTTGYRRRDLYALFGLEAALLGLAGGALGSVVGVGTAALVRVLVQRVFLIDIPFRISVGTVFAGVLVGVATALIFGLLPIVRAGAVRPQAVLRDLPYEPTIGGVLRRLASGLLIGGLVIAFVVVAAAASVTTAATTVVLATLILYVAATVLPAGPSAAALSAALYLTLLELFTGLAAALLSDLALAAWAVAGTFGFLVLLAGLFWLVVWGVGRIPVPERLSLRWAAGSALALLVGVLMVRSLHAVGAVLFALIVIAVLGVALPRKFKTSAKLALRSLSRARARTATTIVALFVGVFGIGLILVLGQDIKDKLNDSLNRLSTFNVFAIASDPDGATVTQLSATLPGVQERRVTLDISVRPTSLDGRGLSDVLRSSGREQTDNGAQFRFAGLSGIEGYDLAGGQLPDTDAIAGRVLDNRDVGTSNVMLRGEMRTAPFFLHVGSTVTVVDTASKRSVDLHVVGFYGFASNGPNGLRLRTFFQPIVADRTLVAGIAANDAQTIVSLKLDPASKAAALRILEDGAPRVVIFDLADIGAIIQQVVSNLVVLLVSLASLALLAGVVIIANTVALAMLERRREIGILKAVGHSSRSVLSQVLVENGVVAAIGALAGMTLVTVATRLLADRVLQTDLPVGTSIVLACVGGVVALVVATATLVAWGPTRVRPLEVLRYE